MTKEELNNIEKYKHKFVRLVLFDKNPNLYAENEQHEKGSIYAYVEDIEQDRKTNQFNVLGLFLDDFYLDCVLSVKHTTMNFLGKYTRIVPSSKEIFEDMLKQKQEKLMEKLGNIE